MKSIEAYERENRLAQLRWTFFVPGVPQGKGAWRVVRGTTKLRPANAAVLKVWTAHVRHFGERIDPDPPFPLLSGPWACHCEFYFLAPKKPRHPHYAIAGMGQSEHWKSKSHCGDGDHLVRAVWDALTGVFWADDEAVAQWSGSKLYVRRPEDVGAQIVVQYLGDEGEQLTMTGHQSTG
jgi:Holliday junction resolvase RusA-like endonuclease